MRAIASQRRGRAGPARHHRRWSGARQYTANGRAIGPRVASMRHSLVLFVGLFLILGFALDASAVSRKKCKKTCGATIQACVDQGTKRRECKRTVIKDCRRNGLAVCQPTGPGETYHVATTGTDDAACGGTAAPCRTIQFVVSEKVPLRGAGTIKVAAGTYGDVADCPTGTAPNQAVVCILNKQITLLGGYTPPDWDARTLNSTTIDGQNTGRGVRLQRTGPNEGTASLEMDGFIVANGLAQGQSSGSDDKIFAFGGGVFAEHGSVVLRDVEFRQNRAIGGATSQSYGGNGAGGALAVNNDASSISQVAASSLTRVGFVDNEAGGGTGNNRGGAALGGALFTYFASFTGEGVTFTGNAASAGGTAGTGVAGIEKSDALGGAVAVEQGSTMTLQNVTAMGNQAVAGNAPNGEGGGAFGGAFFAELGTLTLRDAEVRENLSRGGNGANAQTSSSLALGGGIHADHSTVTLERVQVIKNIARSGDGGTNGGAVGGGGISFIFGKSPANNVDAPFAVTNTVIAKNRAEIGTGTLVGGGAGGVWIQGAAGTIEHSTIAANHLGDDRLHGAGVALIYNPQWQTEAAITNSIIADHTDASWDASVYGNAAIYAAENTSVDLQRPLFANNVHDTNDGITGGFNLPPGTFTQASVLTALDADFVAPGDPTNDYHIEASSPARDQALGSTLADDLDGEARPAGAADIGADEVP